MIADSKDTQTRIEAEKRLRKIRNVGPAIADDLIRLGIMRLRWKAIVLTRACWMYSRPLWHTRTVRRPARGGSSPRRVRLDMQGQRSNRGLQERWSVAGTRGGAPVLRLNVEGRLGIP